jgi:hypothetical protein
LQDVILTPVKVNDVSEEHTLSISRDEELTEQDTSVKACDKQSNLEDRGEMFLRNVG